MTTFSALAERPTGTLSSGFTTGGAVVASGLFELLHERIVAAAMATKNLVMRVIGFSRSRKAQRQMSGVQPHWPPPPGSHSQVAASPQTATPSPLLQSFVQNVAVGLPATAQI